MYLCLGIIVEKRESRPTPDGGTEDFFTFQVKTINPFLNSMICTNQEKVEILANCETLVPLFWF